MCGYLSLLEVGLTGPLTNGTLVLATRSDDLIVEFRFVVGHCRQLEWLVAFNLEVKLLNGLESFQIIKANDGRGINLLHEARNISLILKRQFQVRQQIPLVEGELESHVVNDIIGVVVSSTNDRVQACTPIVGHLLLAILATSDLVLGEPLLDLMESLAGTHLSDELVGHLQEDVDEALSHGELTVLEHIPDGLRGHLHLGRHDDLVCVDLAGKTRHII